MMKYKQIVMAVATLVLCTCLSACSSSNINENEQSVKNSKDITEDAKIKSVLNGSRKQAAYFVNGYPSDGIVMALNNAGLRVISVSPRNQYASETVYLIEKDDTNEQNSR